MHIMAHDAHHAHPLSSCLPSQTYPWSLHAHHARYVLCSGPHSGRSTGRGGNGSNKGASRGNEGGSSYAPNPQLPNTARSAASKAARVARQRQQRAQWQTQQPGLLQDGDGAALGGQHLPGFSANTVFFGGAGLLAAAASAPAAVALRATPSSSAPGPEQQARGRSRQRRSAGDDEGDVEEAGGELRPFVEVVTEHLQGRWQESANPLFSCAALSCAACCILPCTPGLEPCFLFCQTHAVPRTPSPHVPFTLTAV